MNDVRAFGTNTNSPIQNVWAVQQIVPEIVLTFEYGDGETIYTFHLYNLPVEA